MTRGCLIRRVFGVGILTWLIAGAVWAGEPAVAEDPEKISIAIAALSRLKGMDLSANPSVKAAVQKVLGQVRGRPEFVHIVRDFQLSDQDEGLLEVAVARSSESCGVEAARLLLEHHNTPLLERGIRATNGVNLVAALGHAHMKESMPLLRPLISEEGHPLELRRAAVRAMAEVREGAADLLQMTRQNQLPEALKPTASYELSASRWPDLRSEAARLLPLPPALNSQPLPPINELIGRHGDPVKGAEVFRRETVGCIRCHQVNGQGVDFGPNLSEIGSKLGADALYQAILDPSAGISFGYEAWQMELKSGDEVYGLVSSETAEEVVVKAVGGISSKYKKADIAKRTRQSVSAMPSGLQEAMSVDDLVNLVAYLGTLKKR